MTQKVDMKAVESQLQQAYLAQTLESLNRRLSDRCFNQCLEKVSGSIKAGQKKCVSRCVDRWLDGFQIIAKTFSAGDKKNDIGFNSMDEGMMGFGDTSLTEMDKQDMSDDSSWFSSSKH